jgi:hypothetical protein
MRKMITLLAAAALVASSFAVAAGNSNDVLQQIQPNASATENPTTLADADTSGAPAAAPADANMDAAKPATTMTHHPKHKHHYKHHCKAHHHKKPAPATTSDASPTTPAMTNDTATPAQ